MEGSVNATLDALVFETDSVRIVGEVVHPIQHSLIARNALELTEIQRVISHPQASAQCARFLRTRLSGVEVVPAASTADAVRIVAESSEPWAALGTSLSAELYGCTILLEGVEDTADNETRFVWLAKGPFSPSDPSSLPQPPGRLGDRAQSFSRPSSKLRSSSGDCRMRRGRSCACFRSSPTAG